MPLKGRFSQAAPDELYHCTIGASMRSGFENSAFLIAIIAPLLLIATPGQMSEASSKKGVATTTAMRRAIEKRAVSVQLITFPDTGWNPVRVLRGKALAKRNSAPKPELEKTETAEIVMFGDPPHSTVRVVRGETGRAELVPGQPRGGSGMNLQVVSFADPQQRPVSILRGIVLHRPNFDLFGPASVTDLDRVAFAVDGAESSHGADLRMWRPEASGPQGPMQITAAAAIDVGGGDRFEILENRTLGRAYLARMFQRYGNWPDAIAAYNWGPRNLDAWIAGGRPADRFPLEVERYRDRVLRDATLSALAERGYQSSEPPHAHPHR